jgi:hypothetical protein
LFEFECDHPAEVRRDFSPNPLEDAESACPKPAKEPTNLEYHIGSCLPILGICLLHLIHGLPHVPQVIESIEDSEYVDTILIGSADKFFNNVIWIVAVANEVLPSQEHLDRCMVKNPLQCTQPFPWVII